MYTVDDEGLSRDEKIRIAAIFAATNIVGKNGDTNRAILAAAFVEQYIKNGGSMRPNN